MTCKTITKMAIAGNKRRKIDHVSSGGEEDDAASFASFGDEGNAEEKACQGKEHGRVLKGGVAVVKGRRW